jgi:hypothetical protein
MGSMLYDFGPGESKVRMFYAQGGNHELHKLFDTDDDLRCRLHNHRFDLLLIPLLGDVLQIQSQESDSPEARTMRTKYRFGSAILRGINAGFTFTRLGDTPMTDDRLELLRPGEASPMTSEAIHSINTTPEHSRSDVAWLVVEGAETRVASDLYSIVPDLPAQQSAEGLYIPASNSTARAIVRRVLEAV